MKKTICTFFIGISIYSYGQTGNLLLKTGLKLTYENTQYPNIFTHNKDWFKLNDKKRDEEAIKFNNEIESGSIKPTSNTPVVYSITKEENQNYFGQFVMGETKFNSKVQVSSDTIKFNLNNGPYPIISKGDTLGVSLYGERLFPTKIKVGDILPGYINDTYLVPSESKREIRRQFATGDYFYNYTGFVTEKRKVKITTNTIQIYQPFYVMAEEDFTIGGKTFKAYKLVNSIWFKIISDIQKEPDPATYFNNKSASQAIKTQFEKFDKKGAIKSKNMIDKMTGANEQGYIESIEYNWYVPELGFYVKTVHYDKNGALQFITELKSIE